MKKFLILTVTAGEGHNSIANSISNKLKEDPNNQVKVLDIFKTYGKPSKAAFINDGYIYACKYALSIYNMVFRKLQKSEPEKKYFNAAQTWVDYETPQLLRDIYEYQPDVIICAHFYCGIMITNLRKKYEIPAKTISILFDYTVHPFWECATGVDYMITPSEDLNDHLIYKGYSKEQLIPYGIPVSQKFSIYQSTQDAREELKLDLHRFTIMIMMGGGGFGGSEKVLKKLLKCESPLQIIVVNGRDEQAKKRIDLIIKSNKSDHIIHNLGFVNNIPTLMSASDCIVGKCGGVTVNESLNKHRVLILPTSLAQQEFDNMVFLHNNKCTIIYDEKYNKLSSIIDDIANNPQKLEILSKNMDKIRKPSALIDICNFANSFDTVTYPQIESISKKDFPIIRKAIRKIKTKEHSSDVKSKQRRLKTERKAKQEAKKSSKAQLAQKIDKKLHSLSRPAKKKTSKD